MKDFKDILKESIIAEGKNLKVKIDPDSAADMNNIKKFLKKEKIKYKDAVTNNAPGLEVTFDDKLQKQIIMSSLKKDLRARFVVV